MGMMPYQPDAARGDTAPAGMPLPAFGLPTGHWTTGLPALGDARFTLRELTREEAPSLFARLTTEEVARFIRGSSRATSS